MTLRKRKANPVASMPNPTSLDPWISEAQAELELFEAHQMRRAMQADVYTGAGLLGCLASLAAVLHQHGTWPQIASTLGEALILWAAVRAARRCTVRRRQRFPRPLSLTR